MTGLVLLLAVATDPLDMGSLRADLDLPPALHGMQDDGDGDDELDEDVMILGSTPKVTFLPMEFAALIPVATPLILGRESSLTSPSTASDIATHYPPLVDFSTCSSRGELSPYCILG